MHFLRRGGDLGAGAGRVREGRGREGETCSEPRGGEGRPPADGTPQGEPSCSPCAGGGWCPGRHHRPCAGEPALLHLGTWASPGGERCAGRPAAGGQPLGLGWCWQA